MTKKQKLVLIGDSDFAEIAYEYFTWDSDYEVAAFAVERDYRKRDEFLGLPVVDFETLPEQYPPADHHFFAALAYTQRNRLRTRLYQAAKAMDYAAASYISIPLRLQFRRFLYARRSRRTHGARSYAPQRVDRRGLGLSRSHRQPRALCHSGSGHRPR